MQGERASLGSLPEALFDDPSELQDFLNFVNDDTDTTFPNSMYHEQRDSHRFRMETGRFEERRNDKLELNPIPMFAQPSNETRTVRNVNLNAEYNEHLEDMNPFMAHPGRCEANGLGSGPLPQNSVRADAFVDGRHKRKARDISIGQPSSSRGFREFQRGESSSRAAPAPSFYSPVDLNASLDHGPRVLASGGAVPNVSSPSVSRNFPVRANPTSQQQTVNPSVFSAGSVIRRSAAPSISSSAAQQPINLGYGNASNSFGSQNPNASATRVPAVSRTMIPPFQWSGSPVVMGISLSSTASADRNVRPRSNNEENPFLVPPPGLRTPPRLNIIPNPIRAGHVGSSSSRTAVLPAPANPYQNHSAHNQRRLSEHLQRSMLSSLAQNQRAARSSVLPASTPTVERVVRQPGGGNTFQGQNRSFPIPGPRQGLNPIVTPQNLQGLASASRGRRTQVALEIRTALEQMRRDGNLRLQDVMLLNQSMVLGGANNADRYRDMRVDVDNMSYEELLSLEERIGDVCTGLNEETISNRLKQHKYQSNNTQEVEPCCVCQEEYKDGEDMGMLECGHDFHSQCIKEWLKRKNLCPICKTTGLNTTVRR